ncbi:Hsp20/alpha crystallin family protein [candidate division KSB1 bacterium]|nr:Hsp20/alpha crystallin family protein [candidate division KSB1 bacterium]RQW02899.1 MAG: Hsp20/alpha crystallin family protein [candidate division KSB1 bacterium]
MAAHLIRVFRELADMAPRRGTPRTLFYNDVDDVCVGNWVPNTDIFETDAEIIIRLELANVSRKDISIKVKDGKLHITGYRQGIQETHRLYFHQMEIHCGNFCKVITLPAALEHNEIIASLQDGILDIRISKQSSPVEIPIVLETDRNSDR